MKMIHLGSEPDKGELVTYFQIKGGAIKEICFKSCQVVKVKATKPNHK